MLPTSPRRIRAAVRVTSRGWVAIMPSITRPSGRSNPLAGMRVAQLQTWPMFRDGRNQGGPSGERPRARLRTGLPPVDESGSASRENRAVRSGVVVRRAPSLLAAVAPRRSAPANAPPGCRRPAGYKHWAANRLCEASGRAGLPRPRAGRSYSAPLAAPPAKPQRGRAVPRVKIVPPAPRLSTRAIDLETGPTRRDANRSSSGPRSRHRVRPSDRLPLEQPGRCQARRSRTREIRNRVGSSFPRSCTGTGSGTRFLPGTPVGGPTGTGSPGDRNRIAPPPGGAGMRTGSSGPPPGRRKRGRRRTAGRVIATVSGRRSVTAAGGPGADSPTCPAAAVSRSL